MGGGLEHRVVTPLRREVEAFRFSTTRLDLRENSTKLTAALHALWRVRQPAAGDPPDVTSDEWREWLLAELARPRRPDEAPVVLPADEQETLGMFRLVAEQRDQVDREAFGSFVLSMTRSVSDVLGRVPARQGRWPLRRPGGGGALFAADCSALRDDR